MDTYIIKSRRFYQHVVMLIALLIVSGCAGFSDVPVTLSEFRDCVSGREQSFSYPLRQTVIASGSSLKLMGFNVKRMEILKDRGIVHAACDGIKVEIGFEEIAPRLTRLRCKISEGEGVGYFSSQEEIYNQIRRSLVSGNTDLRDFVSDMIPVYIDADIGSPVIAYVARGVEISLCGEDGEWSKVVLVSGGTGYIWTKNVSPIIREDEMQEI